MRDYLKSTKRVVIAFSGITLLCSGCTIGRYRVEPKFGRYDIDPQYRSQAFQSVGVAQTPRLVRIDVEYRMFGRNWKSIGRRIKPDIVSGLAANHVFVEADESNADHAGHLLVVVNQHLTPKKFAEVCTKSVVTGFTYGLVSTNGDMYYDMNVTYTPIGGQPMTWTYSHPVHTTVGVMAMLRNENTLPPKDVLPELTEGMAASFANDFAKNDASMQYANTSITLSSEPGTPKAMNRLPAIETQFDAGTPSYMIQPAVATQSTPTAIR